MKIVDLSIEEATRLADAMRKLLDGFHGLHLDVRLTASQKLLEDIKHFFQHQAVLVEHGFNRDNSLRQAYIPFNENHDEYEDIVEKLLMMHVDEPDYQQQLEYVYNCLLVYTQPEYARFMDTLQQQFSEADERTIAENMARIKDISPVHPI